MNQEAFDFALEDQQREADHIAGRLASQAEYCKNKLERLIENLQANGRKANINSLGELQMSGLELDRLCGELGVAVKDLNRLEAVAARSEES
jgi:hypothetical protein